MSRNKHFDSKKAHAIIKGLSWNSSLPIAIFTKQGELSWSNDRMLSLLDLQDITFPVDGTKIESVWPFSNDEKGPPAILSFLLARSTSIEAHAALKNYKLKSSVVRSEGLVVVCAELIRKGDLLEDKESRQLLFRVISHEVRTGIATLRGYTDMMSDDQAIIKERMIAGIERLERVVALLRDLKTELEIDD